MNAILFPILLLFIGIVIVFLYKSIRPKIIRLLSWKLSAIIAGLYLVILIMLVPILYILPDKDFLKIAENKDQAISTSQMLMNDLYNQHFLAEGDLAALEGIFKNSSHTFKVDSSKLSFNLQTNTGSYHVFIEQKDVDDGEIDVSTYVTAQYMGEVNFAKQLAPPTISLKNGLLSLTVPNYQRLEFKHFNSDFTVKQFKSKNSDTHDMSPHFGDQMVYVRVPKGLEINKGVLEDRIHIISSN